MTCGFPGNAADEPSLVMDVAPNPSLYGTYGAMPVNLELTTGKSDMRMAAVAQPLGPNEAPFVMIAGSPIVNVSFQIGLKDDGSASLTIRDTRKGEMLAAEVTRLGHCSDHENFFLLFNTY